MRVTRRGVCNMIVNMESYSLYFIFDYIIFILVILQLVFLM